MAVATTPVKGSGTTLSYKIAPATVYTQVATLKETDAPAEEVGEIDTTYLSARRKTYIPSIPDSGEVSFTAFNVISDPTIVDLHDLMNDPEVIAWKIQAPDGSSPTTGSTCTFSGFLSKFQPSGYAVDDTPVVDMTIRVSGDVVYTAGS